VEVVEAVVAIILAIIHLLALPLPQKISLIPILEE